MSALSKPSGLARNPAKKESVQKVEVPQGAIADPHLNCHLYSVLDDEEVLYSCRFIKVSKDKTLYRNIQVLKMARSFFFFNYEERIGSPNPISTLTAMGTNQEKATDLYESVYATLTRDDWVNHGYIENNFLEVKVPGPVKELIEKLFSIQPSDTNTIFTAPLLNKFPIGEIEEAKIDEALVLLEKFRLKGCFKRGQSSRMKQLLELVPAEMGEWTLEDLYPKTEMEFRSLERKYQDMKQMIKDRRVAPLLQTISHLYQNLQFEISIADMKKDTDVKTVIETQKGIDDDFIRQQGSPFGVQVREVMQVFELTPRCLADYEKKPAGNKKLLFHGSRLGNLGSLLSSNFQIPNSNYR